MKTSELTDAALDWAVRKSLDRNQLFEFGLTENIVPSWRPSSNWSQGGPIIEREKINLAVNLMNHYGTPWLASVYHMESGGWTARGQTALTAAMRCFVASKLGDEVEVPEELR
jgi:hypothetical protein